MIQTLENKIESQINSLETMIEKMKERFNKDLEVIKKSQYTMNNAICHKKHSGGNQNTGCLGLVQWDNPEGRYVEGSGWGTRVHPWQIHVDVWQNQYNIVK